MAGKIKLDGTQFLEKVNNEFKITNSELKLKSTGNTIVDSSGNAVVSESGGNVTLGNVRLPSSGGIKDSAGNNVITESGGTATLNNISMGSSIIQRTRNLDTRSIKKIEGRYSSGNVNRNPSLMPSVTYHSLSGMCANKNIIVRYYFYMQYANHAALHIDYSWDNSNWTYWPTGPGSGGTAGATWGNDWNKYPLGGIDYQPDLNARSYLIMTGYLEDANPSNTTIYVRPYWWSENNTGSIYLNGNQNNGVYHGMVLTSYCEILCYQG